MFQVVEIHASCSLGMLEKELQQVLLHLRSSDPRDPVILMHPGLLLPLRSKPGRERVMGAAAW